ncbi:selenoprotein Pa-like [Clytia hemisphaerica]|uniref:Selenoprotein P N-terminal domain-containing protein n=1 Tax=Clytia hemisphaerica TaxID=252671 RepID=A0A7M5V4Z9_9CNID
MNLPLHLCLGFFIILCYSQLGSVEGTTKKVIIVYKTTKKSWYQKQVDRYYNYHKYKRKLEQVRRGRKKWPKKKGRCAHSPWKIDDVNPVIEEAKRGNMVLLLVFRPGTRYGIHQLDFLNDNTLYYQKVGWKFTSIVLVERGYKLPEYYVQRYKHIRFYQEPKSQNILKKIYARSEHMVIYDACGRQQYSIGRPYSYTRFDLIRSAIRNTYYHYEQPRFCGKCLPYIEPTSKTLTNGTTSAIRTKLPMKPTKQATTVERFDGPFTNRPFE